LLSEYSAKNAKRDHMADALWGQANKLMDSIAKAPPKPNEEFRRKLKQLGSAVTKLLDQILGPVRPQQIERPLLRRLPGALRDL
jgi:hypothetical protein